MVVIVVKRYAVREAEKWRYAVRKAKIGRYAVRKAKIGRYAVRKGVPSKTGMCNFTIKIIKMSHY